MGTVTKGHKRALKGMSVHGTTYLHKAPGSEMFGRAFHFYKRPSPFIVSFLQFRLEYFVQFFHCVVLLASKLATCKEIALDIGKECYVDPLFPLKSTPIQYTQNARKAHLQIAFYQCKKSIRFLKFQYFKFSSIS